jgi:deoxyguanosine kinase
MMDKLAYDYIVIEGNIGTGKTSLATRLANDFNTRLILERFADNPFLPKFYENQNRYAFPLELSFLADRYKQLKNDLSNPELFQQQTISDYILNKSLIFAGITLKDDEYELYQRLFDIINPNLPRPDLLVYLHKDVHQLKRNIRTRGRDYEQSIEDDYLKKLEEGYWSFFRHQQHLRIIVIDTNKVDFMQNGHHYSQILEVINAPYEFGLHRIVLK